MLAAATAAATAFSSRAFATNYSLMGSTFAAGTWGNTAIWSPTGDPGSTDSIIQPVGFAANAVVSLDPAGDSIYDLSFTTTTNSLTFQSGSSTAETLTVNDVITKAGTGAALTFGSSINPVTLAGPSGGYASLELAGNSEQNNTINIFNSNYLNNVGFGSLSGGDLRSDSGYSNSTSTTVTIEGNVSIATTGGSGSTGADFRMLQSGSSASSTANFTVVGNLTGTLPSNGLIEIDDSNSGSLSPANTFNLEGTASGLAVTTGSLEFGTGLQQSNGQFKFATLLLSNSNALATSGTAIPVSFGNDTTLTATTSASYVGLSIVSSGAYSFNNAITVQGFYSSGPLTQTYTIGGQNGAGTTATFSGPITIGVGSLTPNLQVSSSYSGATLAFTGNISQASAAYNQAVTVAGSGVILLTGSNTYGGGTTVNSTATLLVNNTKGSGTGTGSVNVAGVLGGTGTISGALNTTATSATIQPGAAGTIGTLHTGALTLVDNSTFAVDINSNSVVGTTGSSSELISSGTVTLGTSAFALLSVTDLGSTTLPGGDVFTIIQSANPITTAFQNLPEGTDVTYGANTFAISYMGDDVTLTTVTPEPAGAALLAAGAIGMLKRRKRIARDQGGNLYSERT